MKDLINNVLPSGQLNSSIEFGILEFAIFHAILVAFKCFSFRIYEENNEIFNTKYNRAHIVSTKVKVYEMWK